VARRAAATISSSASPMSCVPQQKVQGRLHYRDDQIQLRARVLAAMEVGQQRIVAVPLEP